MLTLPSGIKIWVANQAVDMRKSHDGLAALVQTQLKKDALSGHLFVFFNRPADKVKILYWERNGYCLWYKRLEAGRYRLPNVQGSVYALNASELTLLLEGIELTHRQRLQAV